jgi:hypothetical protein
MKLIFFILTLFPLFATAAPAPRCMDLFSLVSIEFPQNRPLTFKEVELFSPRDEVTASIGQNKIAELTFVKWMDVTSPNEKMESVLGLTKTGQLYYLVKLRGPGKYEARTVARSLNGQRWFQQFFFSKDGFLVGIAGDGNVNIFAPNKWVSTMAEKNIRQRALKGWAISSSLFVGALYFMFPDLASLNMGTDLPLALMSIPLVNALTRSIPQWRSQVERQRMYPDGFVRTPFYYFGRTENDFQQLRENLTNYYSSTPSSTYRAPFAP